MTRETHTYAVLEVSEASYREIADKLRAAGYDHAFNEDGVVDMHGIGIKREEHAAEPHRRGGWRRAIGVAKPPAGTPSPEDRIRAMRDGGIVPVPAPADCKPYAAASVMDYFEDQATRRRADALGMISLSFDTLLGLINRARLFERIVLAYEQGLTIPGRPQDDGPKLQCVFDGTAPANVDFDPTQPQD